jgi:hypothetical protein
MGVSLTINRKLYASGLLGLNASCASRLHASQQIVMRGVAASFRVQRLWREYDRSKASMLSIRMYFVYRSVHVTQGSITWPPVSPLGTGRPSNSIILNALVVGQGPGLSL